MATGRINQVTFQQNNFHCFVNVTHNEWSSESDTKPEKIYISKHTQALKHCTHANSKTFFSTSIVDRQPHTHTTHYSCKQRAFTAMYHELFSEKLPSPTTLRINFCIKPNSTSYKRSIFQFSVLARILTKEQLMLSISFTPKRSEM